MENLLQTLGVKSIPSISMFIIDNYIEFTNKEVNFCRFLRVCTKDLW